MQNRQAFLFVIRFGLIKRIMSNKKVRRIIALLKSLTFKWIRIVFRYWKTNTPYDESTYLTTLKRRGSPLLKFAINS